MLWVVSEVVVIVAEYWGLLVATNKPPPTMKVLSARWDMGGIQLQDETLWCAMLIFTTMLHEVDETNNLLASLGLTNLTAQNLTRLCALNEPKTVALWIL